MNVRKLVVVGLVGMALFVAFAQLGTARFVVEVVDEQTHISMRGVNVTAYFTSRYLRWDSKASVDTDQFAQTDKNGRCRFSGTTNCGDAWVRMMDYAGYYDSEILKIPYTNANRTVCQPVWKPDNMVVTLMLQKVEHSIPLFMKLANLKAENGKITNNQSKFSYDLLQGAWLPPFGDGKHADIEFVCLQQERLEDGKNFSHTVPRYRNSVRVEFCGEDNGICTMPTTSATLKVRTAPADGYEKCVTIWRQRSAGLNATEGIDKSRNYCFRIRVKRDEEGNIAEAYYGKIYGDIELRHEYDGDIPNITGVKFRYYLNSTPLDRNLEWDTKNNLNPVKPLVETRSSCLS